MAETLKCRCGTVHVAVEGKPFIRTECHCTSCRAAGGKLSQLLGALPVLEENGGTRFVLYRKDRAQITKGSEHLVAYHLGDSSTRRVVAGCCNTPICLEFKGGHWLSLYGGLWPNETDSQPEIRTMVGDAPSGTVLDGAVPSGWMVTAGFYARLLGQWIAMGFRSPEMPEIERVVRL